MTRDAQSIWLPSPNYSVGRGGITPSYVLIHGSAGPNPHIWLTTPGSGVSSTYCIALDGTRYQLVDENDMHWANGVLNDGADPWWLDGINPNLKTISIEIEKRDTTNGIAPTEAQYQSLIALTNRICTRWGIPRRWADARGGITGHFSIAPITRSMCPGTLDWDRVLSAVAGTTRQEDDMAVDMTDATMKTFFTDLGNGQIKTKQSGLVVFGDILKHYLKFGGVAVFGLPLTNEIAAKDGSGNVIAGVVYRVFERGIICFDPQRKFDNPPVPREQTCYLLHIEKGQGLAELAKPITATLNAKIALQDAQIAELKKQVNTSPEVTQLRGDMLQIASIAKKYEVKS